MILRVSVEHKDGGTIDRVVLGTDGVSQPKSSTNCWDHERDRDTNEVDRISQPVYPRSTVAESASQVGILRSRTHNDMSNC